MLVKVSGDGFLDLFKRDDKTGFNPNDRKRIKKHNDKEIFRIQLFRYPVTDGIQKLINILTLGQLQKGMKKLKYDDLYHLGIIINDVYVLEKQAVPKYYKNNHFIKENKSRPLELLEVKIPENFNMTIPEFIKNGEIQAGSRWKNYHHIKANCQWFIRDILDGNKLNNSVYMSFVFQDIPTLLKKHKNINQFGKFLTDLGAVLDVAQYGNGLTTLF